MQIEDATGDLSRVIVLQHQWIGPGDPVNGRYSLYDDATGVTTLLPVKEGQSSAVRLLPDARRIVFSSNDPDLQSGPVAKNCSQYNGILQPLTRTYCAELYLYDLVDGSLRQLTGIGGSSPLHNVPIGHSADGRTVDYTSSNRIPEGGGPTYFHRVDLETGESVDIDPPDCCSWLRGDRRIEWHRSSATLTSEDLATGEVTILSSGVGTDVARRTDDGRFVVLVDEAMRYDLIDIDTGTDRRVPGPWVSDDGARYLLTQLIQPGNFPRLVVGPVKG
jgi:hypothetical protein